MRDTLVGEGQLFQPDVMLPSQFFGGLRKRVPQEAEYLLMLAVLQDAIECFQKYRFARDEGGRELFEDARVYVESLDREWPFSFENICMILNLEPGYVRRGLHIWEERECSARRDAKVVHLNPPDAATAEDAGSLTARAS